MKSRFLKMFSASFAVFLGLGLMPGKASAVNISIGVGGEVLPGVYGSVNIDNGRYPALVYAEPLIVSRPSRILAPVYLHVPPGHLKKWGRYCGQYGACSRPVYFVKSRDYYGFSPRYIEQRYVYRDRVTYVNRGPSHIHHHHYDRWDHDDRRDYRRDRREFREDRREFKEDRREFREDRREYREDRRGRGWDD